jgi:4-hydroxybenzoate polyprenyltransferase
MKRIFEKTARSLAMIKFAHTIFALPFALTGMCLAQFRLTGSALAPLPTFLLIVFACYCARTAAMTFNRIVDRKFDALNPRTKNRELVTGALSLKFAWTFLVVHAFFFIAAAWSLNPFAGALSPLCLAVLLGYSYTKRFTALSHLFLGLSLGLAPIGAWIAIDGSGALQHGEPFLLGLGVLLWTAGFDVIYACQDYKFDTESGLHSLVQRYGPRLALHASSGMHLISWLIFLAFWWVAGLGTFTLLGTMLMGGLMVYEHWLIEPGDKSRINLAFFNVNGLIGIVFFCCVLIDLTSS